MKTELEHSFGGGPLTSVLVVVLTLCIVFFVTFDIIGPLGRFIPQEDLSADYFYGVIWALFLGVGILVCPVRKEDKGALAAAWTVRCMVTLVFMLYYEYTYDNDSFYYFYDSTHSGSWEWTGLTLGAGTVNFWRLTWLHAQIFPNSFHMMKVTCSMAGFIATYIFYRAAVRLLKRENIALFFVFSLFPSILFWSSTLGKDPFVLVGIALYVYGVAAWYETNRLNYVLLILFGTWVTMTIRIWLGPILIFPLAVFVLSRMRRQFARVVFIGIVAAGFLFGAGRFQEQFNIETSRDLVSTIDENFQASGWDGGSRLQQGYHFSSVSQLVAFIPLGVFTALFRPLPGEVLNPFGWLAGLENLILLGLLFQAIRRTSLADIRDLRVLWGIILILTWSTVYGFTSFQNLGAAVRFRLQILPVLLGVLLYLRRDRTAGENFVRE